MNVLEEFINICAKSWNLDSEQTVSILLSQSHNKSLRLNNLKATKNTLKELNTLGVNIAPLTWATNCYEVTKGYIYLKESDLIKKGSVVLQDSSSFIPVIALDPKPHETILDLCAAPGGKTSHIASLTKNKAILFANDSSKTRFFRLKKYLNELGVNAECTLYDGRHINKYFDKNNIDKILLDAPCSGEANVDINNPKTYVNWSLAKAKRLSRLQTKLLIAAYDLVKPGGTIIYSTCTINPEENEKVINNLIKKRPATVEPIELNLNNRINAITTWDGKLFDKTIQNTFRILPSPKNEAFYVAKISKPAAMVDDEYKYFI